MKKNTVITKTIFMAILSMTFASYAKPVSTSSSVTEGIPTVQKFKKNAVPKKDIEKIVKAGINAQSGMNKQPWHFTVITNSQILNDIGTKLKENMMKNFPPKGDGKFKEPPADMKNKLPPEGKRPEGAKPLGMPPQFGAKAGMGDSPLAILVSAKDGADFDAGLATEMMTVQASLLGYGTKIISSTNIVLNGSEKEDYKKLLGIPEDMSAKAVILIGSYDKAESDAVTGPTPRKNISEIVTYVE